MYRQIRNRDGSISTEIIKRVVDNAFIPCDTANSDYIAYLEWKAIEGNDILAPEE